MADSRFAATSWVSPRAEEDIEDDMISPSPCEDEVRSIVLREMCRTYRVLLAEDEAGEKEVIIIYI